MKCIGCHTRPMPCITVYENTCLFIGILVGYHSFDIRTRNRNRPRIDAETRSFQVRTDIQNHIKFASLNQLLGLLGRNPMRGVYGVGIGCASKQDYSKNNYDTYNDSNRFHSTIFNNFMSFEYNMERGLNMVLHSVIIGIILYCIMIYVLGQQPIVAENRSILIASGVLIYMILFGHGLPTKLNRLI